MSTRPPALKILNKLFYYITVLVLLTNFVTSGNNRSRDPPHVKFEVREEMTPTGTIVGRLSENIFRNFNKTVNDVWIYKLLTDPKDSHFFDIDSSSGLITTTRSIDRESINQCRGREICDIHLDVTLHKVGLENFSYQQHLSFQVLKVTIAILDINDHRPEFRDTRLEISINEAAALQSSYILPTATDLDSPVFGIQEYKLEDPSDTFGLVIGNQKYIGDSESYSHADKHPVINDLKLSLKRKLDRETKPNYQLKLIAVDPSPSIAYQSHQSTASNLLHIEILILDSNDNRPEFAKEQYEVTILENIKPNSHVIRVEANDFDHGDNGCIKYLFSRQTNALHGHVFSIDKDSGDITVIGVVDYEMSPIHQLVVIAQDKGPDVLSSEAMVVIRVKDENDNAPTLAIHTLSFDSSDDQKQSPNAVSNNKQKLGDKHSDIFYDPVSIHQTVSQSINTYRQRNKNLPWNFWMTKEMAASAARAEISEDSPIKTFVAHVRVHDIDSGLNGRTNCSIVQLSGDKANLKNSLDAKLPQGMEPRHFKMINQDATEYRIETSQPLDREKQDYYAIVVKCRDLGTPSRLSDKILVVSVTDVNDCVPTFQQEVYNVTLTENSAPGTSILHLIATDDDIGDNGFFYFQLPETVAQFFNVDSNVGLLTTRQSIDREIYDNFRFPIIAVDKGKPPLTGSVLVEINIKDVNDERPIFIKREFLFNISEAEKDGSPIGYVTAVDKDSSAFNTHRFCYFHSNYTLNIFGPSYVNRNLMVQNKNNQVEDNDKDDHSPMSLDSATGLISLKYALDREQQEYFRFVVAVYDINQPSLSDTAVVFVHVIDVNDNPPEIHFPLPISFDVDASSHGWSSNNSRTRMPALTNSILGSADEFRNVTKALDSSFQSCMMVSSDNNSVQISNKVPATSPIARILAKDRDLGVNAMLQFGIEGISYHFLSDRNTSSLVKSLTNSFHYQTSSAVISAQDDDTTETNLNLQTEIPNKVYFRINKSDGILYTTHDLTLIDFACISIFLRVTDSGSPPLSSHSHLFVYVNNSLPYIAFPVGDVELINEFEFGHSDRNYENDKYDARGRFLYDDYFRNNNQMTTLVAVICGCGFVVLLLSVAIGLLIQRKEKERRNRKYNCRVEALRILTSTTSSNSKAISPEKKLAIAFSSETSPVRKSLLEEDKNSQCPLTSSLERQLPDAKLENNTTPNDVQSEINGNSIENLDTPSHSFLHPATYYANESQKVWSVDGSRNSRDDNSLLATNSSSKVACSDRNLPPPPPPPRGSYWLQHQQHQQFPHISNNKSQQQQQQQQSSLQNLFSSQNLKTSTLTSSRNPQKKQQHASQKGHFQISTLPTQNSGQSHQFQQQQQQQQQQFQQQQQQQSSGQQQQRPQVVRFQIGRATFEMGV